MKITSQTKTKAIWLLIGVFIGLVAHAKTLGKNKGLSEKNQILMEVVCSMPQERLTNTINQLELPAD